MDSRGWALVAVCLLSTCWCLPVQNVFGLEKNNTGDSEEPPGIFEIITKENIGITQLVHEEDIAAQPGRNARICRNNSCFWPKSSDGTVSVPYTLSPTYSARDVAAIKDAMSEFAKVTCIRFVTHALESDYLQIMPEDGCWSYTGKTGGGQLLSLSGECLQKGVIQHELNHALGFYHEHTRSDRDNYLTIMKENIAPEDLLNFYQENTNNLGLPYDYASVMHYGRYAYSNKRGQPSMVPKPDPNVPIGQRIGLSTLDVSKINTLYQCNLCNTLLTGPTGTLMSPINPSSHPNNVNCVYLIRVPSDTDKILLLFDAFDLQSSPNCTSDYLTIYDGNNKTAPVLLSKACGTRQLQPFTSSGNEMLLEFVMDRSITANGFKAFYSSVNCGGTFTSSGGTVSSPYYPNVYHPKMDCGFYLVAPTGYKVSLTFTSFSIESHPVCAYDFLSIFDGAKTTSPLIGKYCGSSLNPPVTSTGSFLLLQFHSDESVNMKGFQATYTFAEIAAPYGIELISYADDTQLVVSLNQADLSHTSLNDCLEEVAKWMGQSQLKLNNEKTELMLLGKKASLNSPTLWALVLPQEA
ncbi:embryonic protein UVS.2-like [Lissotriton helveticus]